MQRGGQQMSDMHPSVVVASLEQAWSTSGTGLKLPQLRPDREGKNTNLDIDGTIRAGGGGSPGATDIAQEGVLATQGPVNE